MRHLIDPMDLSVEEVAELVSLGEDIIKNPDKYAEVCKRKKLATLSMNHQQELAFPLSQQCWTLAEA